MDNLSMSVGYVSTAKIRDIQSEDQKRLHKRSDLNKNKNMRIKELVNLSVQTVRVAGKLDQPTARKSWSNTTLVKPRKRLRASRYRNESFIFKLLTDENKTFKNEYN